MSRRTSEPIAPAVLRPYVIADLSITTATPLVERERLTVPAMKPIAELCACPGCHSEHVVVVGRHSAEGPKRHCRTCGCTA